MAIFLTIVFITVSGTAMWFLVPDLLIGYGIGMVLGATLLNVILRSLGRKAKRSFVASEIFRKITKYKSAVYHIHGQQQRSVSATVHNDGHDNADIMDILQRQLRFPRNIADAALQHVNAQASDKPLEDKITMALQFIDRGNNHATTN